MPYKYNAITGELDLVNAAGGGGSGDVTAAANLTDNAVVRGDGGAKGVQDSGVIIDDSDNITGVNSLVLTTPLAATSGGTGKNTYTIGDIIAADTTTSLAKVGLGREGFSLISDGTDLKSMNPANYSYTFNEYLGNISPQLFSTGGGAVTQTGTFTGFGPGNEILSTEFSATGGAALGDHAHIIVGNYGVTIGQFIKLSSLSTASEEYVCHCGFGNQPYNMNIPTGGMYFLYDRATYTDGNWRAVTHNGGSSTVTDTSTAVGTTAVLLEVKINAAGTAVTFYIDGTLVATNTTNIYASAVYQLYRVLKSVGTGTKIQAAIDYQYYFFDFSASPRK